MKKILMILSVWLMMFALSAYDVIFVPSLAVNVSDQINYVPPQRGLLVPAVKKVETGQPFELNIFIGVKEASAHPLKLYGTLTVKKPDGKIKEEFKDQLLFDFPAGAKGILSAGKFIRGEFESGDAPGNYEWHLQLTPSAGSQGKKGSGKAVLTLVQSVSDRGEMTAKEFDGFFRRYYLEPKPERILAAWEYYMKSGVAEQRKREGENFNPLAVLKGFSILFRNNPQFHDDLAEISCRIPDDQVIFYALIFNSLGKDAVKKIHNILDQRVLKEISSLKGNDPLSVTGIANGAHLDMLWAEFFVTGSFEPVRRLVNELRSRPSITVDEARRRNDEKKPLNQDEFKLLMNEILKMAALWSLRSNLEQGEFLLGCYMETIMEKKLYADSQTAALITAIFEEVNSKRGNKK